MIAFVAVFTLVSPYSWRRLAFVKGLVYHTVHGGLVEPSEGVVRAVAEERAVVRHPLLVIHAAVERRIERRRKLARNTQACTAIHFTG